MQRYLQDVAFRLESAERERDRLSEQLAELGGRDLTSEFDKVAEDIRRILEEAQATAAGLRHRAATDADEWRSEARAEADSSVATAAREAEELRRAAWETSKQMIEDSRAESVGIRQGAERDALSILGEAEREAHRTVSAARREAEDMVRVSKMESDRLTVESRTRHDEIIEEARLEAETAQERARALEVRRAELLAELETVRSTIQRLEAQIDERTAVPEKTEQAVRVVPAEAAPQASDGADEGPASEWGTEENVRIVPAAGRPIPSVEDTEVDASRMADEVRRMREAPKLEEGQPVPSTDEEPAVPSAEPAVAREEAATAPSHDDVEALFDALRLEPGPSRPSPGPKEPVAESQEQAAGVPVPRADPAETQARLLVPIVNERLRNVKRRLTDAQSEALEALREDAEWTPDPSAVADELRSDLVGVVREAYTAGARGASDLFGIDPIEIEPPPTDPSGDFADEMSKDLERILDEGRKSGQDATTLSSSVSRVYRTWRTDQAERRVAVLAEGAYREGMQSILAKAGMEEALTSLNSG